MPCAACSQKIDRPTPINLPSASGRRCRARTASTSSVSPSRAGEAYSDLAGAILRALLDRTEMDFAADHGRVPGGSLAVVAMGKLGSREMTASSDLDLLVIYDADPA